MCVACGAAPESESVASSEQAVMAGHTWQVRAASERSNVPGHPYIDIPWNNYYTQAQLNNHGPSFPTSFLFTPGYVIYSWPANQQMYCDNDPGSPWTLSTQTLGAAHCWNFYVPAHKTNDFNYAMSWNFNQINAYQAVGTVTITDTNNHASYYDIWLQHP